MPEQTFKTPPRGNLKSHETESNNESTATDGLLEQVEKTKAQLREVFNGLHEITTTLKTGDLIEMDGATGTVAVLEEVES